jgi:DNA-binding NtrC family response regulator
VGFPHPNPQQPTSNNQQPTTNNQQPTTNMPAERDKFPLHPILLVDDDMQSVMSFDLTLRSGGFNHTLRCQDSREVLSILSDAEVDLILLDLMMPHFSGEQILSAVTRDYPEIPVIMVTGTNELDTAVRCMRQGAFDYVLKPVDEDRLLPSVRRAVEVRQLRRENTTLTRYFISDDPQHPEIFSNIITRNRKMKKIFQYCEAIAPSFHPILITGETGVGKDLIARAVHDLSRRRGEFVAVNVAGLDDNVFSDTLFGHAKGAFTGADRPRQGLVEKAAGGTLFLDEIGDLNEASQVKLLRLLEQREYFPLGLDVPKPSNARFLAATHKPPKTLQEGGRFRSDLYYRLCTHHIHIPPLRDRLNDIPLLFDSFLDVAAKELGKKKPSYHHEIITLLRSYHFPGNVRELKSMVFDAVSKHKSKMLSSDSFKDRIQSNRELSDTNYSLTELPAGESWASNLESLPSLKEASRILIQEAMRRSGNNQRVAALMLGITPQAMNQRIKKINKKS